MVFGRAAQCRSLGQSPLRTPLALHNALRIHGPKLSAYFTSSVISQFAGQDPVRPSKISNAKERQRAEREQLIKSLKESPGKRDAKNFLKHFDTPKKVGPVVTVKVGDAVSDVVGEAQDNAWRLNKTGVNLGNLYTPPRAMGESPVFTRQALPDQIVTENVEPLHIALVKLRQPQALDKDTLEGIALILSQMVRLGMNIAVVVDIDEDYAPASLEITPQWEQTLRDQCARIVEVLEDFNEPGAFVVDQALSHVQRKTEGDRTDPVKDAVEVSDKELLFPPLSEGIIPVVPPIAYDPEFKKKRVDPDNVILALTREFAGPATEPLQGDDPVEATDSVVENPKTISDEPSLDRIIILDPLGGLPSKNRADGSHVFINLEAEYKAVKDELRRLSLQPSTKSRDSYSVLGGSNPFSKFTEAEIAPLRNPSAAQISDASAPSRHSRNLEVVNKSLKLLPPSSSALIITPEEAAISSQPRPSPSTGVRTRPSKNPLIHNLLTDKPMISSSLPYGDVHRPPQPASSNHSTFLKKGIPVTIIPFPSINGWTPISPTNPSIALESDPRINFPRLVDLIEDSFRRKLNVKHYLDRIRGRIAGIIIAGDYEGGAICTWETPPSYPDSGIRVPYLDKFAVLTSSQGSGGVADIVWGALTRTAFPSGLVWRSRTSNPVNKWYFERSVGVWNLPGGAWTMFWTTHGVAEEWAERKMGGGKLEKLGKEMLGVDSRKVPTRWEAYVDVCTGIEPSWADGKKPD